MPAKSQPVPIENIENRIYLIRGQKIMLDYDLAELYDVSTKRLNEQVRRNQDRFPEDFMFRLTAQEVRVLRSQFATAFPSRRNIRFAPYAFTEHGALMLASVLNSERAIQTSIFVVRAFAHLRQLLTTHADLARKLEELEKKYDAQFHVVFDAIRQLMTPPEPKHRPIGFGQLKGEKAKLQD